MSSILSRRDFFQWTAAAVAAWHAPFRTGAVEAGPAPSGQPRLRSISLRTAKLNELRAFYRDKLQLSFTADAENGFTFQAGPSVVHFQTVPDDSAPFYHFAFNIPENQFAQAKAWLAQRTPLLIDNLTGKDEVFFQSWNAHAVYFRDPAGNIGELIARHRLKNPQEGPFSQKQFLCVSEIGMVAPDAGKLGTELARQLQWPKAGSELVFVGDDDGYLIAAPTGRPWLPDRVQKAAPAPVEVILAQGPSKPIAWSRGSILVR